MLNIIKFQNINILNLSSLLEKIERNYYFTSLIMNL